MAGLQEQVRQLEEVNVDMLEETTRYERLPFASFLSWGVD